MHSPDPTLVTPVLHIIDTWARQMVSPWCPVSAIGHELRRTGLPQDETTLHRILVHLVDAGRLEWGARPLLGGARDVRRSRPPLAGGDAAIIAAVRALQTRMPLGWGVPLPSITARLGDLADAFLQERLEDLTSAGDLTWLHGGWRAVAAERVA